MLLTFTFLIYHLGHPGIAVKELEWTSEHLVGGTENLELAMAPSSSTSLPYFLKFP